MIVDKDYCLVKVLYFEVTNKSLTCDKCVMANCPHAKNTPHVMTEKTNQN